MRCSMKPALFSLLLAASSVISSPIWADDQTADDAARGVARISFLNGDVSVRRGDSGEIVAAAINAPLVLQDSLLTGSGSTAEIQFDSANMIRLGQNSEVRLTELAYHRAQMQVANGTATFRILRDSDSRMEIDTPQVSVRPGTQGSYRITIREDGTSEVAVRSGEAEIFTPPVAASSSARAMLMRLPFSSLRNICPPPAPQQNERSRARGGSDCSAKRSITARGSS